MSYQNIALVVVVIIVAASLWKVQKDETINFNLLDLLLENGKVSKVSCLVMGSWALHSWIMVSLQMQGKMTEGYLTIYGATWVAPLLVRIFSQPAPAEKP